MASEDHLTTLLQPFLDAPGSAGVLTDFDGTLAPIVDDPVGARPLPNAVATLHRLARHYRRVAVVSGRPAAFLMAQLGADHDELVQGKAAGEGLIVSGLYGLEAGSGGVVTAHPGGEEWKPVVDRMADEADEQMPDGVVVERKGLTVTLHFRTRPDAVDWVRAWADEAAARSGLAVHPARMSFELVPPIPTDKGRVVWDLAVGLDAVCFLGDDEGDLPAFDALDRLRAQGVHTVKVVVASSEASSRLLDAGDVVVEGPEGALDVLTRLVPAQDPSAPAASS
ncbi:MAG: trehalose 6-phosphate phosphatase [Acidimicrobiaceae bacterium]|nr:trehalose 6-phosphate phosphatase [Acidimicrobiaceae bacterium]